MNLDESITNAFEAIREFASFDSHSLVPHPDNLRFQVMKERCAMHRLGTKLAEIVCDRDGEDLQYCAHTVRRYHWQELGLSQPPDLPTDVLRFLLKPDHTLERRIDVQELALETSAAHAIGAVIAMALNISACHSRLSAAATGAN